MKRRAKYPVPLLSLNDKGRICFLQKAIANTGLKPGDMVALVELHGKLYFAKKYGVGCVKIKYTSGAAVIDTMQYADYIKFFFQTAETFFAINPAQIIDDVEHFEILPYTKTTHEKPNNKR